MQGFCVNCFKEQDGILTEETIILPVKKDNIEVLERYLKCPICGEKLANDELFDETLTKAYEQYKKQNKLLTAKEIKSSRKNLGMSAATLAKNLGLGSKTITRYENGYIQTKKIDKQMRKYILKQDEREHVMDKWMTACGYIAKAVNKEDTVSEGMLKYLFATVEEVNEEFKVDFCDDNYALLNEIVKCYDEEVINQNENVVTLSWKNVIIERNQNVCKN